MCWFVRTIPPCFFLFFFFFFFAGRISRSLAGGVFGREKDGRSPDQDGLFTFLVFGQSAVSKIDFRKASKLQRIMERLELRQTGRMKRRWPARDTEKEGQRRRDEGVTEYTRK